MLGGGEPHRVGDVRLGFAKPGWRGWKGCLRAGGEGWNGTDLLNAARSSGKCQEKCQKKKLSSFPAVAGWERGFSALLRWVRGGCVGSPVQSSFARAAAGSGCPGFVDMGRSSWGAGAGSELGLFPCTPGMQRGAFPVGFPPGAEAVLQLQAEPASRGTASLVGGAHRLPKKRASRASTLASGRRRMDLSAQPPPSSSSQKGNGLKKWQVLIITRTNPLPPPSPSLSPPWAPSLDLGLHVSWWGFLFRVALDFLMALHHAWLRMGGSLFAGLGAGRG